MATKLPLDQHLADDLVLFATNDQDCYANAGMYIKNSRLKIKRDVYDTDKAAVLWAYHATSCGRHYNTAMKTNLKFSPATLLEAGRQFRDYYDEEVFGAR